MKTKKTKKEVLSEIKQKIVDNVIANLENNQTIWSKGFIPINSFNYSTKKDYQGINRIILASEGKFTKDPRWMTFVQAKSNGLVLKEGEHALHQLLFSKPYSKFLKNQQEAAELESQGREVFYDEKTKRYYIEYQVLNYFNVFNAEQFENIEPYVSKEPKVTNKTLDQFIDLIIKNAPVQISESHITEVAHYKPGIEKIVVPTKNNFIGDTATQERFSTLVHELAHWTGDKNQLNRPNFLNTFGTSNYAREELVAALTEMFVTQEYGVEGLQSNHQAYVNSWVKLFKEKPNELFRAANLAEKASTYLKENILDKSLDELTAINKTEKQEEPVSAVEPIPIPVVQQEPEKKVQVVETKPIESTEPLKYSPDKLYLMTAVIYCGVLLDNIISQANADARKYLATQRKIPPEFLKKFEIGVAPSEEVIFKGLSVPLETSLANYYKINRMELVNLGLSTIDENGNFHDTFINRIIIPIKDEYGKIVGFSGRSIDGSSPKYLNTKTTEFFQKSKIIYNLNNCINQKNNPLINSQEIILVEGFFDVITFSMHCDKNIGALMGTELTNHQIELLKKHNFKKVVLAMDFDKAGYDATLKNAKKLKEHDFDVKVLANLPIENGIKDLSEYFTKGNHKSLQTFNTLINQNQSVIDYLLHHKTKELQKQPKVNRNQYLDVVNDCVDAMVDYAFDTTTFKSDVNKIAEFSGIKSDYIIELLKQKVKEVKSQEKPKDIKKENEELERE